MQKNTCNQMGDGLTSAQNARLAELELQSEQIEAAMDHASGAELGKLVNQLNSTLLKIGKLNKIFMEAAN